MNVDATTLLVCVVVAVAILSALLGRGLGRITLHLLGSVLAVIAVVFIAHRFWPETIDGPCKWTATQLQPRFPDVATWIKETAVCKQEA